MNEWVYLNIFLKKESVCLCSVVELVWLVWTGVENDLLILGFINPGLLAWTIANSEAENLGWLLFGEVYLGAVRTSLKSSISWILDSCLFIF